MTDLLQYQHFYLVGIKGVAMTSLAQCLLDAGKKVSGSDLAEDFVTAQLLRQRNIHIDIGFEQPLPPSTECVVYTSAHQAQLNPHVQRAQALGIPTLSQAEALGTLFSQKKGVAVCGVGGKSTTSAMITWILEKTGRHPSFSVGVGNIPGLEKTGAWVAESRHFVAEADEYVIDPAALSLGRPIVPRFSFLFPTVTVCTNLKHDHPDVYPTFSETLFHFRAFFSQIRAGGVCVVHLSDWHTFHEHTLLPSGLRTIWFGTDKDLSALPSGAQIEHALTLNQETYLARQGRTSCELTVQGREGESAKSQTHSTHTLTLQLPGFYNILNATAAVAACMSIGVLAEEAVAALASFRSTQRRCEFIGEKHGVRYYDDYAHHPHEVASVIRAYREWFPNRRLVVGFQSHTFSRTKQFFTEFVDALSLADEVVMIDIFPSAREAFDPTVSSDQLCHALTEKRLDMKANNLHTLQALAQYCRDALRSGDVFLTVGAGDIYLVHDQIESTA